MYAGKRRRDFTECVSTSNKHDCEGKRSWKKNRDHLEKARERESGGKKQVRKSMSKGTCQMN